jgi:Asp-tRNA(Asn)/Glu-tRNA(Gln) amidotransferase A subunit family amidase
MPSAFEMPSSIRDLSARYRADLANPCEAVKTALKNANLNAGRNVYLALDEAWSQHEAEQLLIPGRRGSEAFESQPLWGIPISLKDCFDLKGYTTTCGSQALGRSRAPAAVDSAVAYRLRTAGAIITGKTHLQQLAYGITGENRDFGDCLQPPDPKRLTGGSSSGAAASVQEGSAMAAIGTDTGGSIRVPASLCGLAGYRASITMSQANGMDLWHGGEHLAQSFDTIGWLYRNLSDGPLLGAALFGLPEVAARAMQGLRVGLADASFLHDCEEAVLAALEEWASVLQRQGAHVAQFDTSMWHEAMELYVPLQASEAAALHLEPRDGFEPAIAERLRWGASLAPEHLADLRKRLTGFRQESERRLASFDLLLLPNSPTARLCAGEDHSEMRLRILRYTTPVSLLGWPAVTLPSRSGGPQLVGRLNSDAELLAVSAALAEYAQRQD